MSLKQATKGLAKTAVKSAAHKAIDSPLLEKAIPQLLPLAGDLLGDGAMVMLPLGLGIPAMVTTAIGATGIVAIVAIVALGGAAASGGAPAMLPPPLPPPQNPLVFMR